MRKTGGKSMRLINLLISLSLLGGLFACTPASTHFREIATPDLPYIAMIRTDRTDSSKVVYNPVLCEKVGDACGFFRSHAYAHLVLNHELLPPGSYPDSLEAEADCFAARNADPEEVLAAFRLLTDENRNPDIPITGDPAQRAQSIRDCAVKAGNWTGNV